MSTSSKVATPKVATPKVATPKVATPSEDRMDVTSYDELINRIRKNAQAAESLIQEAFLSSWRDIACSHSCGRLDKLWDALAETKSPFKTQVSLAMRALAGMAKPVKNRQKWERTGRAPLAYQDGIWSLFLEDEDKRLLEERAGWEYHFRAIQVKAAKSTFTWQEVAIFAKRIETASKQGRIPEKDLARCKELLGEIERISAR